MSSNRKHSSFVLGLLSAITIAVPPSLALQANGASNGTGLVTVPGHGAGSFYDIKMTPNIDHAAVAAGALRADAAEIADLLEVTAYVERLREFKKNNPSITSELPKPLLNAKVLCLWRILTLTEEVRHYSAAIDCDLASSNVVLAELCAKRDATSNMLNTANFAQGGVLGITKQSLLLSHYFNSSQMPIMISASLGMGLAMTNLMLPPMWKSKITQSQNILSHFINTKYRPPDADHSYLFKFFTSEIPGSDVHLTRREILLKHWQAFKHLNPNDDKLMRKLSASPEPNEDMAENIKVLSLRIELLHDLKTHVEEVDGALYELHKAIRSN
ncbi:MAG: hypothetical protein WCT03_12545 [Candidatus Obscuribacterales bacterium]